MSILGSIFLGDAARYRVLSPSPSSPPMSPIPNTASTKGLPIDPELSLELRVRWLEVLLLGIKQDASTKVGNAKENASIKHDGDALVLKAEEIQKRLCGIVESNDGLKKFMDRYDQHAQILTPAFALSGISAPPSYSSMSSEELDAFLAEMEPDIRSADRDLREIDILEKRGVLGAGKLADYETLASRLDALRKAHEEDLTSAGDLECRVANVLMQYTTRIDALSELFVEWNDILTSAEDKIARLEREKAEKVRFGYES
ncbi:hypothetical protein EW145_g2525 [Phellinidium pouzarii]|uniref:Uncharacterized protein n=1 Tax=Phellinidium pouzarii TaxID=167371 RepID=A0A4S4LAZ8_9AGAM|nr:hypothetical protein EW145_g2525 [Phellinidium pouzarii]